MDKMNGMKPAPEQQEPASPVDGELAANEEQAGPEEQAEYERFVAQGIMLLYDERMMPKYVEQMRKISDPREALAVVAHGIFTRIEAAAKESGREISGDVKFAAGQEIFENVATFATKAGIHDFENDEEAFEGAWYRALDKARMTSGNPEAAKQDLQMLAEAEQRGDFKDLFKGAKMPGAGPQQQKKKPAQAQGLMPRKM